MISFRYHVVSLVAVLLSLAAGVALGGGPLSDLGRGAGSASAERAEARADALTQELDRLEGTAAFQDQVAGTLGVQALNNRLTRRPVTLVTLPGVDQEVVDQLGELVARSGGSVAATYAAQPGLVVPTGKSLVDTLGSQVLESVGRTGIPPEATTYERMGQLIGRAVATPEDRGARVDGVGSDILSSLRGAELLTRSSGGDVRGSLVVVVLGEEPAEVEGVENIVGGLSTGLAAQADGLVVAGSTDSAADGLLGLLREEASLPETASSVDSVQTVTGRVTTVLALAAAADGEPGHYGALGIDGALPRG